MNNMAQALRYAQRGWRVFPGPVGRKPGPGVPLMSGWPRLATTDVRTIVDWWSRTPAANICAITGDGFFVLDVDDHSPDASGSAALAALEREHGDLPPTLTHSTPSLGVHHVFRLDFELPTKIGWRPGLDILAQGAGRCVLLPPSITERGQYSVLVDAPIAAPPTWLTDLLRAGRDDRSRLAEGGRRAYAQPAARGHHHPGPSRRRLVGLIGSMLEEGEGNRSSHLHWAACRAAEMVHEGAIDRNQAEDALIAAAVETGLTDREARATVRSGFNTIGRKP